MRALFDRDSALYFKPGDWNRLAPWLLRFWTYCNERDHAQGTGAIARLGHDVFDLIEEMRADGVEFELHKQGMVYAAAHRRRRARRAAQAGRRCASYGYDLPDDVITGAELHELEPALSARGDRRGSSSASTGTCKSDTLTAGLAAVAAARRRRDPGGRRGVRAGAPADAG